MGIKLVILASGRGTNFAAIADAAASGNLPATIAGLVTNNATAPALGLARERGIPAFIVDSERFRVNKKLDRVAYETELSKVVARIAPDFICLAGYMLLLGETFVHAWPNRILNIHPSLLPAFKGLRAQKQALDYGCRWTGCTVHFVNEELDAGAIVLQDVVEIREGDTEETLVQRLLPIEHRTYLAALEKLCTKSYRIEGRHVRFQP